MSAFSSAGGTSVQRLRRGSATDDWLTPPEITAALGDFDLDPCVPAGGPPEWSRSAAWFSPIEDGLAHVWNGMVWLNPPYSKPAPWLERMAAHGNGVALIFCRTETGWWHEHVWPVATSFRFLRRRVSFLPADGLERVAHNAPAPSVLVAYGAEADARIRGCGIDGYYLRPRGEATE